jgi:hypothetical protein
MMPPAAAAAAPPSRYSQQHSPSSSTSSSCTMISTRRRRTFFRWEAHLDRETGIASSAERSEPFKWTVGGGGRDSDSVVSLPKDDGGATVGTAAASHNAPSWVGGGASSSSSSISSRTVQQKMTTSTSMVRQTSREFVSKWADFVCKGSVTFGLFHVVKKDARSRNREKGRRRIQLWPPSSLGRMLVSSSSSASTKKVFSSSLQPRLVPLSLLEFGPIETKPPPPRRLRKGKNRTRTMMTVWEIPITGGILALPPPPITTTAEEEEPTTQRQQMMRSSSSSSLLGRWSQLQRQRPHGGTASSSLGRLVFAVSSVDSVGGRPSRKNSSFGSLIHQWGSSSSNNNNINNNNNDDKRMMDDCSSDGCFDNCYQQLTTNIVGYRPWLAGSHRPVPWFRQQIYLSTQSCVHAYIIWRFHKAWKQKLLCVGAEK